MDVQHLGSGIPYADALQRQEQAVADVLAGGPEQLLLLEHAPVYTIGRQRDQSSLRNPHNLPHPVHETNRGGQATYHGPGQLVGYPVIRLDHRGRDLHAHLRHLEEALILACATFGVHASRRDGLTGVWCGPRKIASLGVGVRKWVSMHGFAINITAESLPPFFAITPCGIDGVIMTCLEQESHHPVSIQSFSQTLIPLLHSQLALP